MYRDLSASQESQSPASNNATGAPPRRRRAPPLVVPTRTDGLWEESFTADERTLFRYSALTFNTHRIHYDAPYTQQVEGYRGILIHGPLTATLLMGLLHKNRPANTFVGDFDFRAVKPAVVNTPLVLRGGYTDEASGEVWAQALDPDETVVMTVMGAFDPLT